jgi:hypothetical protein
MSWLTLAALVSVGILVADRLLVGPAVRHWQDQSRRIAGLREALGHGEILLERKDALRTRWATMRENALPPHTSDAEHDVLEATARWARDSRVVVTSLVPRWRAQEDHRRLEFEAAVAGNWQQLMSFLYALERDPIAVRFEHCRISARDETGRRLAMEVRFSALQLSEEETPDT